MKKKRTPKAVKVNNSNRKIINEGIMQKICGNKQPPVFGKK
jgi:hypothetical protein